MKTGISLLSLAVWGQLVRAQPVPTPEPASPRRVQVGIDLTKTPIALIGMPLSNYPLKKESFITLEPVVLIKRRDRLTGWQGQMGFTRYTGAPVNSTYLNLTGGFLKAGPEWAVLSPDDKVAILLVASTWQTSGEVRTPAGAFAASATPIPTTSGGAVGAELQTNRDIWLGDRWMLRLLIRYNVFWRTMTTQAIIPKYLPGLGLYLSPNSDPTSSPISFTGGASFQLMYFLNRRGRFTHRFR